MYKFDFAGSVTNTSIPADCPDWILELRPIETRPIVRRAPSYTTAIPVWTRDPITLARSWGVRFTGRVSPRGWAECHAIDRDDVKPSAAVHAESGVYTDRGSGLSLSLARLGVVLGRFIDIRDAMAYLQSNDL